MERCSVGAGTRGKRKLELHFSRKNYVGSQMIQHNAPLVATMTAESLWRSRLGTRTDAPPLDLVYYIWDSFHGGRNTPAIKIGHSHDLRARLRGFVLTYGTQIVLLATEPGGIERESELHQLFKHLRWHGTEWFVPGAQLFEHIERLRGDDWQDALLNHSVS
jgi:hypothetical protein